MGETINDPRKGKRFLGWYRGTIAEIDPSPSVVRVRLIVPEVLGPDLVSNWAYMAAPLFGGSYSPTLTLGERVMVSFVGGDPDRPLFAGQWFAAPGGNSELPAAARGQTNPASDFPCGWTSTTIPGLEEGEELVLQMPSSAYSTQFPNSTVLSLPSGLQIELDSTPNRPRAQVWHPAGSYTEMRPDGGVSSRTAGNRFDMTDGSQNEIVRQGAYKRVDGPCVLNSGKGIQLETSKGPVKILSYNGEVLIASGDLATRVSGAISSLAGNSRLETQGPFTFISADLMTHAAYRLEDQSVTTKKTNIGNAFSDGVANRTSVAKGTDLLEITGVGSRTVTLTEGVYSISVVSGSYLVTVSNGPATFSVPAGAFSVTALEVSVKATAAMLLEATTKMDLKSSQINLHGVGTLSLHGGTVSVISDGTMQVNAPLVVFTGTLQVGTQISAPIVSALQGLVVGAGMSSAAMAEPLFALLQTLATVYNAHTHAILGAPPSAPMVPTFSFAAAKARVE